MRKNRLPKYLTAAAVAAMLAATPVSAFSDTSGHWAEGAVNKWSQEYQIIQGYEDGTFRPDASITRGAFAGIMDRFLKFQVASGPETFSDTPGTYWETAILKLHAAGVYLGNGGKALAGDTITRQQAITMIARAFGVTGTDTSLPYIDADLIADYAKAPVAAMTNQGYITDSWNGDFRPTAPITRGEIVNVLNNMVDVLAQETKTYSGDVDGTLMVNATGGAALENMTIYGDLILAPGAAGDVTLSNVTVMGTVRNFSGRELVVLKEPETETPEERPEEEQPTAPAIQPGEVYTPGKTTGQTITYSNKQIPVYEDAEPSRLYAGDFVWDEERPDRLRYVGGEFGKTRFGIDVSAYQNRASENNTIDWEAVADDGVDFVMVRAGLRGTSTGGLNKDAFFEKNVDGAMAAGLKTGVYFFAQAITVEEAIEEADFVIELLKGHEINGPVAYDWEMHDSSYRVYGTTPEMATACAIAFCKRIEEAGYTPMVYAGQYVSYIKYDQGALAPYLSWYPEYKNEKSEKLYPTYYYQMDYWQFSSNCSINGIGGRVDANIQFVR